MLVTHDMLKKSTPVCIAFNHMPWHYLAVARLDIGGQRKHFIWKTNFKKRFEWDGSFNAQTGEMLRITLNMLHDAGYLGLPESWKPGDEDDGQPPAWFELKQEAERHRTEIAAQARQQTAKRRSTHFHGKMKTVHGQRFGYGPQIRRWHGKR